MYGRLRKEQSTPRLQLVATVLLCDGRETQKVFEHMQEEGLFVRLVGLVGEWKERDPIMWRVCLDLMYEMSRIQRLRAEDFGGYCHARTADAARVGIDEDRIQTLWTTAS